MVEISVVSFITVEDRDPNCLSIYYGLDLSNSTIFFVRHCPLCLNFALIGIV